MKNTLILIFLLLTHYSFAQTDLTEDIKSPGLIYTAELIYGAGVGNVRVDNSVLDANYEGTYGARFLASHKFANDLAVGGAVMYSYYSESGFLLLGPDLRYFLSRSLFVAGNAGYGISIGEKKRGGGFFYYPSAGLFLARNKPIGLTFSLGYMNQTFYEETNVTVLENGIEQTLTEDNRYTVGFLQFTAGIVF